MEDKTHIFLTEFPLKYSVRIKHPGTLGKHRKSGTFWVGRETLL